MGIEGFETTGVSRVRSIVSGISRNESLLLKTEDNEDAVDDRLGTDEMLGVLLKGCLMFGDLARKGFEELDDLEGMDGFAKLFL